MSFENGGHFVLASICLNELQWLDCKTGHQYSGYSNVRQGDMPHSFIMDGWSVTTVKTTTTLKPVCNDHLYNEIYYLWFIQ